MSRAFSGGKRNREASRDLKKRQKEERLRRNRDMRARGIDPDMANPMAAEGEPLPEVKLEDIIIGVASESRRANFGPTKLFVGGELHDLTASDDRWQLSSLEASLAAVGPRRSYRDYYNRRGVQITGALRLHR